MKILITGSAGFIGFSLANFLLKKNYYIIGIDNHNNYYDVTLKKKRVRILKKYNNYFHYKADILKKNKLENLFKKYRPNTVFHFAAQAGVRYSIENPKTYMDNNVMGFFNVIELCKKYKTKNFIYASSSSVYGSRNKVPYSELKSNSDDPFSLYAATKKCNELIAIAYSNLFNLKTIGLRFFTVYGPWGRPDMSYFKFTNSIMKNKKIYIYNNGRHLRDFTYIDDAIDAVYKIFKMKKNIKNNYKIINIGNDKPIKLLNFIKVLERTINKIAQKKFISAQKGDVIKTHANISVLKKEYKYEPKIEIETGLKNFFTWYKKIILHSNK